MAPLEWMLGSVLGSGTKSAPWAEQSVPLHRQWRGGGRGRDKGRALSRPGECISFGKAGRYAALGTPLCTPPGGM